MQKNSVNTNGVLTKNKPLLAPGHRACAGCGQLMAARNVIEALGPNTIIANATGCLEVTTTPYPESAWGVPWIHSLFENAAAIASGINAALIYKKSNSPSPNLGEGLGEVKVVAQGGDGSTFDIGFGLISGMWARGENILYVCYDNEAYANTGMQASAATPFGSNTTTTPSGENDLLGSHQSKKDMIAIALAHGLPYVAQTTAGYPTDIQTKVKKALSIQGPAYIQILVPCIPGWKVRPDQAIELGKLAVQTGLYPSLEYTNGELTNKMKITQKILVENYLKPQGRFSHLFKNEEGKKDIEAIQRIADRNIERYKLLY
jgi:pyruvate ferredoxin oxidoreductase beta subunit